MVSELNFGLPKPWLLLSASPMISVAFKRVPVGLVDIIISALLSKFTLVCGGT